ncbi:MAG: QueT transporter family protein [Phascolarctobacterium sp.]|nr:MAG: QueT transporter family protein [Phascolarctobacterium sp.]
MKEYSNTQKITIAGMCIALYIAIMLCTQSFAFGQYQVRIATAMYSLSAIFPFLILPFGLANIISNTIMGGLGPLDMIGGGIVGVVTTYLIAALKRRGCGNWCILMAITLVPGLGVPVWLSVLLDIPYLVLVSTLLVGQFVCGIAGMALVTALEKTFAVNIAAERK